MKNNLMENIFMHLNNYLSNRIQQKVNMVYLLLFVSVFYCPLVFSNNLKSSTNSGEILVSNIQELNSAISSVKPGDTIIMKDGVWHDAVIEFSSSASASAPVILRAQTPGGVILNGNSQLIFTAPNLVADGLYFNNGAIDQVSVILFRSDSCRFTNSAIINYNPAQFETQYYWVFFKGNHNRFDHCLLKGKSNMGPVIGNDNDNAEYNKVDNCYIKDIPYEQNNGREIIRVFGYGHADEMGEDGAYFTIENNLFERAHGEGVEIISLKSNYNIVRYNTIRATRGGIVSRRGKNNTIEGNFILGEGQEGTIGIRVAGPNQRVINNYIANITEDGIRLIAGEYYKSSLTSNFQPKKKDLPKYLQVQNGYFAHNTIIHAGENGINIGFDYKNHWSDLQMVLIPENNVFVNNLIYKCKYNAINVADQDSSPPLDFLKFKPNYFENNIVNGGGVNIDPVPSGIKDINPNLLLYDDGLFRPAQNSPLINAGAKSDVVDDVFGNVRDEKKDIGAIEFGNTKAIRHPLSADEVGPEWVIKRRIAGENF